MHKVKNQAGLTAIGLILILTPLLCFAISDFGVILSGPIPPTT